MTAAERLREEGREEGRQQGREEGRQVGAHQGQAKVLLRQLNLKFGNLSETIIAQVEAGMDADFERWTERVLLATALEQVFDDASSN